MQHRHTERLGRTAPAEGVRAGSSSSRLLPESEGVSMIDPHPWTLIQQAIQAGNETEARELLQKADSRLRGQMRVSADQAIKRAFPPEPPEFVGAKAKQDAQNAASNSSAVAAAIARRRERINKRLAAKPESKPTIGWNVMPKDGVEYKKAEPFGFNTPPK